MGKDTYSVSRQGTAFSTSASLRAECLKEANAFCAAKGLSMVPVSTSGRDGIPGVVMGNSELVFRAVPERDAENQRPNMRRGPDHHQMITIKHE